MRHTVRRMQNKIINECEPNGHILREGLIVESYTNDKTKHQFEIVYDHDTTPVSIKNLTTGESWNRE
jgi:hypothetical protein